MIVVLGSRHDPVAAALTDRWPEAALCAAEDLTMAGWVWPVLGHRHERTWVVNGAPVADDAVSGVFVRRATVYPDELHWVDPEDRAYAAAEAHAFCVLVLATTGARVSHPVVDGAIGAEAVQPARWMPAADAEGLTVAPLRLTSRAARRRPLQTRTIEVVDGAVVGDVAAPRDRRLGALARRLSLPWAAFVLDGRGRLVTVSCRAAPSELASDVLVRYLSGRSAA